MHLPLSFLRPPVPDEPPAFVRAVVRGDVQWNRPIFRAPPLEVRPPVLDLASLSSVVDREDSAAR